MSQMVMITKQVQIGIEDYHCRTKNNDGVMHNDIRITNERLAESEVNKCCFTTSYRKHIQRMISLTAQEFITTTAAITITTRKFF